MSGRLEGKFAIITGAGSGMGAAMAASFCREGARVIAADISGKQNQIAEQIGEACIPYQVDVSSSSEVQRMIDTAEKTFGRLDIICNNAAVSGELAKTGEYREEEFDRIWAINGRSVFLGMRYAIPLMLKSGGGSIVNTASLASLVAWSTMPAYCAAKGAVLMMTKTAAVEYATQGIRVNAICPGTVKTGLSMAMPQEYIDEAVKAIPIGRIGTPDEIANVAIFLASEESSFITGTTIVADGGYTAV